MKRPASAAPAPPSSAVPAEFTQYTAAAVWMPPDALLAWEGNPNIGDVEKVAASLLRFGFIAPICIWTSKHRMAAGHTRLAAFRLLRDRDAAFVPHGAPGPGLVPVRFHEFRDDAEAEAYALADNRLSELGSTDDAKLAAAIARINAASPEMLLAVGYDDDALAAIRARAREAEQLPAGSDPDEVPEPPKVAITKPGDIWVLGRHRVLCGDCRDAGDVAKLLGDAQIAVAFTSPPYASQRKYDESSGFKPIPPGEFVAWFEAVQANVREHLAPDGSWFVNIKEHCEEGERALYVHELVVAHRKAWSWAYVDELCWERVGVPGRYGGRFKNGWEPIFHFATTQSNRIKFFPHRVGHESEKIPSYSAATHLDVSGHGGTDDKRILAQRAKHRVLNTGIALPCNRLPPFASESGVRHTAAFPVALPEFFIKAFSDDGDAVFDPFMGSGTTLIACERTGRRGFGTEISPAYCDVIVSRWEKYTGQKAVLAGAPKVEPQQSGNRSKRSPSGEAEFASLASHKRGSLASRSEPKPRGKQRKANVGGRGEGGAKPARARAS